MSQPKVLFVLTSHNKMGNTGKPTGWYLVYHRPLARRRYYSLLSSLQPEFAHPYDVLAPDTQITIASPAGGEAPLDPASIDKSDKVSATFLDTKEALWKNTEKLSSFLGRAKEFDAIFYVGGHGRESVYWHRPPGCPVICSSAVQ